MPTMEEAESKFYQWRASKVKKYERIPEDLIFLARSLASTYGVNLTARRLKVSPSKLVLKEKASSIGFVEVPRMTDFGVITVSLKLSPKREITVTVPSNNVLDVSELIKKISKL